MNATLKDLASELGLSPATVSMALHDSPRIAQATRNRVNRYAATRGYVRNEVGAALALRRTRMIGFLLRGVMHSFYNEVLQGAGESATEAGYGLLLGWNARGSDPSEQLRLMLEKNVDALILAENPGVGATLLPWFLERGKPVVFCTGSAAPGCSLVRSDDHLGGRLAMELLISRGHREVAISDQWAARYEGNRAAAREAGIRVHPYSLVEEALELVLQHREITGIVAYSDDEAIRLLHLLRAHDVRVPEEVSVVGFDDLPVAALPEFSLTTVAQQRSRLGAEAVRLAIRLAAAERPAAAEEIVLAPHTVMRNTVADMQSRGAAECAPASLEFFATAHGAPLHAF